MFKYQTHFFAVNMAIENPFPKNYEMGMGQNPGTFCSPQVIAGKWMFIPLKMYL